MCEARCVRGIWCWGMGVWGALGVRGAFCVWSWVCEGHLVCGHWVCEARCVRGIGCWRMGV